MKVLGLITEYNPFHFGHKHHLEYSKNALNATHTISIMSGSFVQRGEPSLVDKWTKAKMAIDNGVDLVIELPFIYAVQSAELFALGAVKILDSINSIDYISFGSEIGDNKLLYRIADILVKEPPVFKDTLKNNLSKGLSFPISRSKAVKECYNLLYPNNKVSIDNLLQKSNNILGIEYLKALKILHSNIRPFTIQRLGHNYNDVNVDDKIASATGIRNKIFEEGITSIKDLVPKDTYFHLLNFYESFTNFNNLDKYSNVLDYILITKPINELKNIFDMEDGLENRIVKYNQKSKNISDLIQGVSTKRYTKTRIQRILIHTLLGLNQNVIESIYEKPNKYIRVLASNKKGLEILKTIKNNSDIHVLSKFADYKYINDKDINLILQYEKIATNLFYYGINKKEYNMDYLISPYIK